MKKKKLILSSKKVASFLDLKTLGKLKLGLYIYGVISGVIFGLLVNILTLQLQEMITRQQYLEALEFEIMGHFTQSTSSLETINQMRIEKAAPNSYLFKKRFDTNVWESGAALGYIYTIEPETQAQLSTYYSHNVNPSNRNIEKMDFAMNDLEFELAKCIIKDEKCDIQSKAYYRSPFFYEEFYVQQNEQVASRSSQLLKVFQPTNERLKNPILKLLMGKKALPILGSPRN